MTPHLQPCQIFLIVCLERFLVFIENVLFALLAALFGVLKNGQVDFPSLLSLSQSLFPRLKRMIDVDLPLYFFLLVFGLTVLAGLISAPYQIYREERDRRFELELARKPKQNVDIENTDCNQIDRGSTSQAYSGRRQTLLFEQAGNALSLVVENTGEKGLHKCIATLVWAECVEGEKKGPFKIFEPIILPWSPIDPEENLESSIEPNTVRRVWLADINYRGFTWSYRDRKRLPAEYQQIFGPTGKYRAVIQVSDGESICIRTKVEIFGGESAPTATYQKGTGRAMISIIEQESEHQSRPYIPTKTPPKIHRD